MFIENEKVTAPDVRSVALQPYRTRIQNSATLKEALDAVVSSRAQLVAVFEGDDYLGMLSAARISREIVQ